MSNSKTDCTNCHGEGEVQACCGKPNDSESYPSRATHCQCVVQGEEITCAACKGTGFD